MATKVQCHICSASDAHEEFVSEVFVSEVFVSEVFIVDGEQILVENIPAQACDQCGEATFSRETTEEVRLAVRSKSIM